LPATKIKPVWGGRYIPAVKAFLDVKYGPTAVAPLAPNGVEGSFHGKHSSARKSPGLKWRHRQAGRPVPYWFADKKAIDAGYPVKSANLSTFADHPAKLIERAQRLQSEMLLWLSGQVKPDVKFDGTFKSLLESYERDPESSPGAQARRS
jgi:hypothetical protein